MTLYFFVLSTCCSVGYVLYEIYSYLKKKRTLPKLSGPSEQVRIMNQILYVVNTQAKIGKYKVITKNKVSKVLLMEDLDLRPQELKKYIKQLKSKGLLEEMLDYITITPFGVEFCKVFSNDKFNFTA